MQGQGEVRWHKRALSAECHRTRELCEALQGVTSAGMAPAGSAVLGSPRLLPLLPGHWALAESREKWSSSCSGLLHVREFSGLVSLVGDFHRDLVTSGISAAASSISHPEGLGLQVFRVLGVDVSSDSWPLSLFQMSSKPTGSMPQTSPRAASACCGPNSSPRKLATTPWNMPQQLTWQGRGHSRCLGLTPALCSATLHQKPLMRWL